MNKVPSFKLYGADAPEFDNRIQPKLPLRSWDSLSRAEKQIALLKLRNEGFFSDDPNNSDDPDKVMEVIIQLNNRYLRLLPGKNMHYLSQGKSELQAGIEDFENIFMNHPSGDLVLCMLSLFAKEHISGWCLHAAQEMQESEERASLINQAFDEFDRLANSLNQIFEQFSINILVTRGGFIPRQDDRIDREIYQPTLKVLSDPKWKSVSDDLADMFNDYQKQSYPEVITKAHSAVQRFLQILVGNEGKNGKGELGSLFACARKEGVISENQFTREIVKVFHGFISSERANNSTAKPSLRPASSSDALLAMNVVMVFIQHCLKNAGHAGNLQ